MRTKSRCLEDKDLKAQNIAPLTGIYIGTVLLLSIVHFGVEEVVYI